MPIVTDAETVKDLTDMAKEIEQVLMRHLNLAERPALALAFTLPPDYIDCHWVTNLSRGGGVDIFEQTAEKMREEMQTTQH